MSPTAIPGNLILKNEMVEADPFFNNVSLLLHGDGANGSTTIVDSSPSPKTVTVFGDAQISTAQSKFGGASLLFDGDGDRLDIANSEDFTFGTGDYTIEGWLYQSTFAVNTLVDLRGNGTAIGIYSSIGNERLAFVGIGITQASIAFTANEWTHWAVTREGSTIRLFVGGTLAGSAADNRNYTNTTCRIGHSTTGQVFNGYIDDLRITKGIARYASNFTPPTAPFPEVLG